MLEFIYLKLTRVMAVLTRRRLSRAQKGYIFMEYVILFDFIRGVHICRRLDVLHAKRVVCSHCLVRHEIFIDGKVKCETILLA